MSRLRRDFDRGFGDGAVRIVDETGRPVAEIARELGVDEGTLGTGRGGIASSGPAGWVLMSGRSWFGCASGWPSWRWNVVCSNDLWSVG